MLERRKISSFLTASLFCFCLAIGSGVNIGSLALALFGLIFAWKVPQHCIDRDSKILLWVLCLYFLTFIVSILVHDENIRVLDRPSRSILSILILLSLLRFLPKINIVNIGIIFGAIISGIAGFIFHIKFSSYIPDGRAFNPLPSSFDNWALWSEGYMAIQSGGMAVSLGLFSLITAIYFYRKNKYILMSAALLGFISGIVASVFSGSRGGWICVPIILFVIIFFNRDLLKLFLLGILLSVMLCFVGGEKSVYELTKSRLLPISSELTQWQKETVSTKPDTSSSVSKQNKKESSTGIRLELWKDAYYTFQENPILGAGSENRVILRDEHRKKGLVSILDTFDDSHAHNQFFEALSVRGILGFGSLMALFLWPLYVFKKRLNLSKHLSSKERIKYECVCLLGICHILLVMGYCMTQAWLEHNSGITFYTVVLCVFFAMSSPKNNPTTE